MRTRKEKRVVTVDIGPVRARRSRIAVLVLPLIAVSGLTACSGTGAPSHDPWDVAAVAAYEPLEAPVYERDLFAAFVDLADVESREGDWRDVRQFLDQARHLLAGTTPEPTALEARSLTEDWGLELEPARDRLMAARLGGARTLAPAALARAHAAYECWIQEAEENRMELQGQDLFDCRDAYFEAMAEVDEGMGSDAVVLLPNEDGTVGQAVFRPAGSMSGGLTLESAGAGGALPGAGEAPRSLTFRPEDTRTLFGNALDAQPVPPSYFTVANFAPGSARLPPGSAAVLDDIIADAEQRSAFDLVIVGYADTVGTVGVNRRLGQRRANQVRDSLRAAGLEPERIIVNTGGEEILAVQTANEEPEARNRRVFVTVR